MIMDTQDAQTHSHSHTELFFYKVDKDASAQGENVFDEGFFFIEKERDGGAQHPSEFRACALQRSENARGQRR